MASTSCGDNCRSKGRRMPVVSVSGDSSRVRLPARSGVECPAQGGWMDCLAAQLPAAQSGCVLLPNMLDLTFAITLGRNSCLTDSGTWTHVTRCCCRVALFHDRTLKHHMHAHRLTLLPGTSQALFRNCSLAHASLCNSMRRHVVISRRRPRWR